MTVIDRFNETAMQAGDEPLSISAIKRAVWAGVHFLLPMRTMGLNSACQHSFRTGWGVMEQASLGACEPARGCGRVGPSCPVSMSSRDVNHFRNLLQPNRKNLCFREHRAWLRRHISDRDWNRTRSESPTHWRLHLALFS